VDEGKEVKLLKSRIVHRPKDLMIIHNEIFKVSERALIYKPMYKVTFQNTKTKKTAIKEIDAITGKAVSEKKQKTGILKRKNPLREFANPQHDKTSMRRVYDSPLKTKNKTEPQPI
jgi:hypothetical protein